MPPGRSRMTHADRPPRRRCSRAVSKRTWIGLLLVALAIAAYGASRVLDDAGPAQVAVAPAEAVLHIRATAPEHPVPRGRLAAEGRRSRATTHRARRATHAPASRAADTRRAGPDPDLGGFSG